MLRNYLSIALRNAGRHKGYAFINIAGLAVGLAACLLIGLYVRFELSFDRMHANAERIVRIEMDVENSETGTTRWKPTMVPVGPELEDVMPEIETTVRVGGGEQQAVRYGDVRFYEDGILEAESSLFDVFDFRIVSGDASALDRPETVMLSESMVEKYFGDDGPMGKVLQIDDRDYEVVGVFRDMPVNVHFRADFLSSIATRLRDVREDRIWYSYAYTYALLAPGVGLEHLRPGFDEYASNVIAAHRDDRRTLDARSLTDIHLFGGTRPDIQPQGDIRYVWIFSGIAVLILIIACINYMNLAMVRSAQRSREVGVRKVVGAQYGQLIRQFLSESILFAGAALVLAIGLAQIALPSFNAIVDKPLALRSAEFELMGYLLGVAVVVGLLSGIYPALVLARMKPASVLKGVRGVRSNTRLRKGLVIFQFVISMTLIVGTLVIQRQLDYVHETELGFHKDQMMILETRGQLSDATDAFKQEIARQSTVMNVSMSSSVPSRWPRWIADVDAQNIEDYDGEEGVIFDLVWVDHDFVDTFDLEVLNGRSFDQSHEGDKENAVLINEAAGRALGWVAPIGKGFRQSGRRYEVVGVFRDFHNQSMKHEINPMVLLLNDDFLQFATIRLSTKDLPKAISEIRNVWSRFIPGLPFQYSFLDDEFDAMYRSEQRLARLFGSFAGLAVLIAALGLLGLAAFTTQQRTKEIGIRKVLGASVSGLVVMLSKEFVRLVIVAFVVAAPIAYFVMDDWLSAFAYRVDIGAGIFLFTGLMAIVIAVASVTWQAVRAATADPVKNLRYE